MFTAGWDECLKNVRSTYPDVDPEKCLELGEEMKRRNAATSAGSSARAATSGTTANSDE